VYKKEDEFSAIKEKAIKEVMDLICNNKVSKRVLCFMSQHIIGSQRLCNGKVAFLMNETLLSALI